MSRLSGRAATTDLDGHVRTGGELPHGPRFDHDARPLTVKDGPLYHCGPPEVVGRGASSGASPIPSLDRRL
jgi:hypothetical protein